MDILQPWRAMWNVPCISCNSNAKHSTPFVLNSTLNIIVRSSELFEICKAIPPIQSHIGLASWVIGKLKANATCIFRRWNWKPLSDFSAFEFFELCRKFHVLFWFRDCAGTSSYSKSKRHSWKHKTSRFDCQNIEVNLATSTTLWPIHAGGLNFAKDPAAGSSNIR